MIDHENCLAECSLKLQQYHTAIANLVTDTEENTKCLNDREAAVMALSAEMDRLQSKCQMKSRKIEAELKELELLNRKQEASGGTVGGGGEARGPDPVRLATVVIRAFCSSL